LKQSFAQDKQNVNKKLEIRKHTFTSTYQWV